MVPSVEVGRGGAPCCDPVHTFPGLSTLDFSSAPSLAHELIRLHSSLYLQRTEEKEEKEREKRVAGGYKAVNERGEKGGDYKEEERKWICGHLLSLCA